MTKKLTAKKKSAVFGAAMSSLFVSSEIQADILDFTFDSGNPNATFEFNNPSQDANVDQLFGSVELSVDNNYFQSGPFGTIFETEKIFARGYISSLTPVSSGATLDPGTFRGQSEYDFANLSDSALIGFRTRENNVGWFRIEVQSNDDLIIDAGELSTVGEKLVVGGTAPPPVLGDANCDGVTNLLDVAPFVEQISSGTFVDKSDLNRDGVIDLLDVAPFVALLNGAGNAFVENGELQIRATTGDDVITVARVVDSLRVTVNGTQLGDFSTIDRILIDARQGNDTITVQPTVELETRIYAGPGDDTVFGGSGNDNIFGAQGDDTIFGRDGNDYIVGAAGDNEIYGQNGDDLIYGGQVAFVSGGNGDDTIFGGGLADEISGDAGNDLVEAGGGDDIVRGGAGNDILHGFTGNDTLMGDAGEDMLDGSSGMDTIHGGPDNDTIEGGSGEDTIYGGLGDDVIGGFNESGDDTMFGGDGDDMITAGSDDDMVFGEGGDDVIDAGTGDDMVLGGDGDDFIEGQAGFDVLSGDAGNDTLFSFRVDATFSDPGNQLYGGPGNDTLHASNGDFLMDALFGEGGNDLLLGSAAAEFMRGGPQNDMLMGGPGDDEILGDAGDDILAGEGGNDFLNGGADIDEALDFGEAGHINIEIDPG